MSDEYPIPSVMIYFTRGRDRLYLAEDSPLYDKDGNYLGNTACTEPLPFTIEEFLASGLDRILTTFETFPNRRVEDTEQLAQHQRSLLKPCKGMRALAVSRQLSRGELWIGRLGTDQQWRLPLTEAHAPFREIMAGLLRPFGSSSADPQA